MQVSKPIKEIKKQLIIIIMPLLLKKAINLTKYTNIIKAIKLKRIKAINIKRLKNKIHGSKSKINQIELIIELDLKEQIELKEQIKNKYNNHLK